MAPVRRMSQPGIADASPIRPRRAASFVTTIPASGRPLDLAPDASRFCASVAVRRESFPPRTVAPVRHESVKRRKFRELATRSNLSPERVPGFGSHVLSVRLRSMCDGIRRHNFANGIL